LRVQDGQRRAVGSVQPAPEEVARIAGIVRHIQWRGWQERCAILPAGRWPGRRFRGRRRPCGFLRRGSFGRGAALSEWDRTTGASRGRTKNT
jgi:hypothetical protein